MGKLKQYKYTITILAVLLIAVVWWFMGANKDTGPSYESVMVERGDVERVVSVTGRIEPAARVPLAFEVAGKIDQLFTTEGDQVTQGQTLAILGNAVLSAKREEAYANLLREEAVLDELLSGTRFEEVAVAEASLQKSDVEVERAKADLTAEIERTYLLALDEVREKTDQLFEDPNSSGPGFGIEIVQGSTKYTIGADRESTLRLNRARGDLNDNFSDWAALVEDVDEVDSSLAANQALSHLTKIQNFVTELAGVVNGLQPDDTNQQAIYDNYKADVSSAKTAVTVLTSALRQSLQTYEVAKAGQVVADRQLVNTGAAPRNEAVRVQEASVARANAQLQEINAELGRTIITAPLSGIVTSVEVEAGEVITAGTAVATIMSGEAFELTAFIPEADIAHVLLGNGATFTLDAFDRSRIFSAQVASIAPAETILDGVPTYETTLVFSDEYTDIRSGMTAELDILTSQVADVVRIPGRSLLRAGARQYVRVVEAGEIVERDISVGLRGSDGMVEIRSGLQVGDEVVLFIDE